MTTPRNRGFTLMELLIVVAIMSILAMLALAAHGRAVEQAKADRTRAIISRLDQLITEKWEGYRVRALPIAINPNSIRNPSTGRVDSLAAARIRLAALRDLQRMELPDRVSDVTDNPADVDPTPAQTLALGPPASYLSYRRQAYRNCGASWMTNWTVTSQGAECLYLIVSTMRDGDKSALDFFSRGEIGDIDGDGMKEILDGWGRPIEFLRWAPGFTRQNGAVTHQTSNVAEAPDPFDPLKQDTTAFALKPLIFSSGPDKEFDIFTDNVPAPFHHYVTPVLTDNNFPKPYLPFAEGMRAGTPADRNSDGYPNHVDNLTNHLQETP